MFQKLSKLIALLAALMLPSVASAEKQVVIFAGGCFWSMQKAFDGFQGVVSTRAGFMGGHVKNPSYEDVVTETTGHLEAVEVTFDTDKVSFNKLVYHYWHNIDPFTLEGQFCDFAPSYHTAIFTTNTSQFTEANLTKAAIATQKKHPVMTLVLKAETQTLPFYPASSFHQHYAKTHALDYGAYALGCGRHDKLNQIWGPGAGQ